MQKLNTKAFKALSFAYVLSLPAWRTLRTEHRRASLSLAYAIILDKAYSCRYFVRCHKRAAMIAKAYRGARRKPKAGDAKPQAGEGAKEKETPFHRGPKPPRGRGLSGGREGT